MNKHIIIIGFKSAGKSSIGTALALKLKRPFMDLDNEIVRRHEADSGETLSCREIMKKHGEAHFRKLEHEALKNVIMAETPMVLAVGGGTPMTEANRAILEKHFVLHVAAPKGVTFERIMIHGKPAFFPQDQEAHPTFDRLWKERDPIFRRMAHVTIENTGSVEEAAQRALRCLIKD